MSSVAFAMEPTVGRPVGELTEFGRLVEDLRALRGFSTSGLARAAGFSRTHLWRAMTGRSTLDVRQLLGLARVLSVEPKRFTDLLGDPGLVSQLAMVRETDTSGYDASSGSSDEGRELADFINDMDSIVRTLRGLPSGPMGRSAKLAVLDTAEKISAATGHKLPPEYYDIRRKVIEGEPV